MYLNTSSPPILTCETFVDCPQFGLKLTSERFSKCELNIDITSSAALSGGVGLGFSGSKIGLKYTIYVLVVELSLEITLALAIPGRLVA